MGVPLINIILKEHQLVIQLPAEDLRYVSSRAVHTILQHKVTLSQQIDHPNP